MRVEEKKEILKKKASAARARMRMIEECGEIYMKNSDVYQWCVRENIDFSVWKNMSEDEIDRKLALVDQFLSDPTGRKKVIEQRIIYSDHA